jgi:hypothetical protein
MSTNVSRREDTLPQAKKGTEERVAWTIIQHPSTEDLQEAFRYCICDPLQHISPSCMMFLVRGHVPTSFSYNMALVFAGKFARSCRGDRGGYPKGRKRKQTGFSGLDHGVGPLRPLSITRPRHLLAYPGNAMNHGGLRQVF